MKKQIISLGIATVMMVGCFTGCSSSSLSEKKSGAIEPTTSYIEEELTPTATDEDNDLTYDYDSYYSDIDTDDTETDGDGTIEDFFDDPTLQTAIQNMIDEQCSSLDYLDFAYFYAIDNSVYYDYYLADGYTLSEEDIAYSISEEDFLVAFDNFEKLCDIRPDSISFVYYDSDYNYIGTASSLDYNIE